MCKLYWCTHDICFRFNLDVLLRLKFVLWGLDRLKLRGLYLPRFLAVWKWREVTTNKEEICFFLIRFHVGNRGIKMNTRSSYRCNCGSCWFLSDLGRRSYAAMAVLEKQEFIDLEIISFWIRCSDKLRDFRKGRRWW